jgi:predicted Zn-dependent protease
MIPNAPARRIAAAVLIVACGARTIARGRDYADLKTFNEATVEASPNAVKALVNAARTRLRLGDAAGARPLLEHAVAVWPDYQRAWHLLAESCDALGDGAHAAEARRGESRAAGRGAGGDEPL